MKTQSCKNLWVATKVILRRKFTVIHTFHKKAIPKKIEARSTRSNSFYEAIITLILKSGRDNNKENDREISLMNTYIYKSLIKY